MDLLAGNHKNIFNDARVPWLEYRYYDPKTVGLDFEGMIADIKVILWLKVLTRVHIMCNKSIPCSKIYSSIALFRELLRDLLFFSMVVLTTQLVSIQLLNSGE